MIQLVWLLCHHTLASSSISLLYPIQNYNAARFSIHAVWRLDHCCRHAPVEAIFEFGSKDPAFTDAAIHKYQLWM
jgi:hypothetical protein